MSKQDDKIIELCRKTGEISAKDFGTLRKSLGDPQEVADMMETGRSTIWRWEGGKRPVPGPARVLIRLLAIENEHERRREAKEVARIKRLRGE